LTRKLFFFGNNDNQLAPDSTINDIKRLWIDLRDLGIFPGSECIKRAKRDEDRYTFFVQIEMFFRDVNKARSFVFAKKEKAKQKAEYLKEIEAKEKENDDDTNSKRREKISKDVTEGFVKPLRKVVRNNSTTTKLDESPQKHIHPSEKPTSPPRKMSPHSKTPVNSPGNNGSAKLRPVLVRKKKGENGAEIIQEVDTAILIEEKKKSNNFSFESFEDMQANAPTHRSGEFQRIMEQLKNAESRMEKT